MGAYKAGDKDYEVNSIGVGQAASGTSGESIFGVGANYTKIENDGTVVFNGDATVWEDAQVVLGTVKFAGASDPTWTAYKGGLVLSFHKAQDNIVYFTIQLSHKYKISSDIEFHIHITYPVGDGGNSIWAFTHSMAAVGGTFPGESTVNKTIGGSGGANEHELVSFSADIGSLSGPSGVILCSLERTGTDELDTCDQNIYVVAMDCHIECDTAGTRQILIK